MIFDLVKDFADVLDAMPEEHPRRRILKLLDEAIRRDMHFIGRHPTTFFQCMWNTCWWYDHPAAADHYSLAAGSRHEPTDPATSQPLFSDVVAGWRRKLQSQAVGRFWLRSLRPPALPLEAAQRLVILLQRVKGTSAAVFSEDGRRLALGFGNGLVNVWDVATGSKLSEMPAPDECSTAITAIAFLSGTGRLVATQRCYGIRVFDVDSGQEVHNLQFDESTNHRHLQSLVLSSDGQMAVDVPFSFGSETPELRLWDPVNSKSLGKMSVPHRGRGYALAASHSGSLLAQIGEQSFTLWDLRKKEEVFSTVLSVQAPECVQFSPDGRWCAILGWGNLYLFDTFKLVWIRYEFRSDSWMTDDSEPLQPEAVAFQVDGTRLAIATDDYVIRIWDIEAIRKSASPQTQLTIYAPDGGTARLPLLIWKPEEVEHTTIWRENEAAVHSLVFARDATSILGCLNNGSVRIWSTKEAMPSKRLTGPAADVQCLAYSDDGRWLASGGLDDGVRLWDPQTGQNVHVLIPDIDRSKRLGFRSTNCLVFSPDSRTLASVHTNYTVLWDIANFSQRLQFTSGNANDIVFSPDGQLLATASDDRIVRLWDVQTGTEIRSFKDRFYCDAVAFSHDGKLLAVAANDKRDKLIRVYSLESSQEVLTINCDPRWWIRKIAFSATGNRLVSRSDESRMRIWDVRSGDCVEIQKGQGDVTTIAAFLDKPGFRACRRHPRTVIEDAISGSVICVFPKPLTHLVTHPNGMQWAGTVDSNVYQIRCESG